MTLPRSAYDRFHGDDDMDEDPDGDLEEQEGITAERAAFKRGERAAVLIIMCREAIAGAVAARNAEIRAAVEGLENYHGYAMRPPNARRWVDLAAVLAIVDPRP